MAEKTKNIFRIVFFEVISALAITYSVVPSFRHIGHLFYQVFLTAALVIVFLIIADSEKIKPATVSHSLIFMTIYWVAIAVIAQIKMHIHYDNKSFEWLHLFYYDKPAMLIVAYFAAFLFFAVKLMKNTENSKFISQYRKFQKTALTGFIIYYFIILIYCFYLVRAGGGENPDVNLIPFNVFKVMKAGEYEYEFIFLFFGNIGIFMPLGLLLPLLIKNKPIIILFPFVLSIGVEISQYFLRNGQTDIDDVILNVIGFFIGYLVKILLDKAVFRMSNGKLSSVFIL